MMHKGYMPKYTAREVAAATGLSEGTVYGYAHNRKIPPDGWTVNDVGRLLAARRSNRRGGKIDPEKVKLLKDALVVLGWYDDGAEADE